MSDVLIEKRDDGVALITLNRPESLNAMGGQLMPLLAEHLADCATDRNVRAVVLTGAGRAFCAGGDVKGMAAGRDAILNGGGEGAARSPAATFARGIEMLRESQRRTSGVLHTMPKPTIAMVNGHAVGAGLSLALACDLRIASDRAKLGTIFRNVGFSGDFGGSYFLPRLVGNGKARELYFSGEVLDAEEAYRIGMVNRVVAHDELAAETLAFAARLAAGPTLAYGRMKENLNRAESCDMLTALDAEALNMQLSSTTNDHREAAKAFVEKRQPSFTGN
ncbi:MAG TPA: enoyl-CoA hydratase [Dehalococcoidia bacterium]|nr:enoyl-CoA hydratase [Dehalococcoidia bacterium]